LRRQSWRPVHAASEHDAAFGIVLITHKLRPMMRCGLLRSCVVQNLKQFSSLLSSWT
jgi:hypothetical protein